MRKYACRGAAALMFLLAGTSAGWGQQYFVYTPETVDSIDKNSKKDGILVQEIQVQKGDTLYGISRKFSGHGIYYPQILLFNDLRDPNKIYSGNTLKVPVPRNASAEATEKQPVAAEKRAVQSKAAVKPAVPVSTPAAASRPAPVAASKAAPQTELSLSELKSSDKRDRKKPVATAAIPKELVEKKQPARPAPAAPERITVMPAQEKVRPKPADATSSQKLFERAVKAYRQDDFRTALDLFDRFLLENPSSTLAPDASFFKAECYLKLSSQ